MNRNYIVKFVGLVLAVLVSVGGVGCGKKAQETIKIGAILPLTGDAGVYGQAIRKGMDLALDEISSASNIRINLIYEDDQGNPAMAVSAVNKLINVNRVNLLIGGAMSSTAEAIIPITEKEHVLLLSPTATKPSLTDTSKYFFRLWPSDNYDGYIMAKVAYDRLQLRRVAILYVNVAYGQGISEVFKREFEKLGGEVVIKDAYPQNNNDFRSHIEKIRTLSPEAIYIPGYVREVSILLKQCLELNYRPKFLGVNSLYDQTLLATAGDAADGAIFTYPTFEVASGDTTIARFVNAFKMKYGNTPDAFAAQGYDAVKILARAIELSHVTSPDGVKNGLFLANGYIGPGGEIQFELNGDVNKPLRLITVKNDQFVEY